jgi:hypothetical protein
MTGTRCGSSTTTTNHTTNSTTSTAGNTQGGGWKTGTRTWSTTRKRSGGGSSGSGSSSGGSTITTVNSTTGGSTACTKTTKFPSNYTSATWVPLRRFDHVLEYIIALDTQAKRDCVMVTAGCVTVEDLLYVETENLLACLEADTPIIAKTRLKTLKKWAKDMFDLSGNVDVADFTLDVCKENQQVIARTAKPAAGKSDKTIAKEKLQYLMVIEPCGSKAKETLKPT